MSDRNLIEQFIEMVKERLNRVLLLHVSIFTACVGSTAVILTALAFIVYGYRCPLWVYGLAVALGICGGAAGWYLRRSSHRHAGRFADDFFDLKDGLSSYIGFHDHNEHGGFLDLQEYQVAQSVQANSSRISDIPHGITRRFALVAGCLMLLAVSLGFVDDSDQVKLQRQQEEQVLAVTLANNKELLDEAEDVVEELEKEQVDAETLEQAKLIQKMVEQLKETKDQKEAMLQYAQLEKQLNNMLNSVMLKKDEQLLENIAKELKDGQEGKELGKMLAQKQYNMAAEELKKYKQDPEKQKDQQEKKQLAKLNTIAQQMQAALSPSQRNSSTSNSSQNNANQNKSNSSGNCSDSPSQSDMQKETDKLSLAELVNKLKESSSACKNDGCKGNCNSVNASLDSMAKKLSNISTRKTLSSKLAGLCDKLGQCQSQCSGTSLCQSPNAGGKGIGAGSTESRTDKITPLADNGNTVSIQGLKGDGPSEKTTEESDSGTAQSGNNRVMVQKEYQRQMESFIQREDIPEEVRQGVKKYFENIHGI